MRHRQYSAARRWASVTSPPRCRPARRRCSSNAVQRCTNTEGGSAARQAASSSTRDGSRMVQVPACSDRLSSKLSSTSSSGARSRTCERSRARRCGQGSSVRSAAATASAVLPPRAAALGCRRSAAATPARKASAVTSPVRTVVTQSGSRRPTRSAIWAASADLPIPPAPCRTSPATAGLTSSADQRRRSAERMGRDGGGQRLQFGRLWRAGRNAEGGPLRHFCVSRPDGEAASTGADSSVNAKLPGHKRIGFATIGSPPYITGQQRSQCCIARPLLLWHPF